MTGDPGTVRQVLPTLPRVELVRDSRTVLLDVLVAVLLAVPAVLGAVLAAGSVGGSALRFALVAVAAAVVLGGADPALLRAVRPPRIVLERDGLTETGPLGVRQAERWEDCVRFSPAGPFVGFQNRAFRQDAEGWWTTLRRVVTGYPATLRPGYGGLRRDELCALLNRYRETCTDRRRRADAPTEVIDIAAVEELRRTLDALPRIRR